MRFELLDDDELAGFIDYRIRKGRHWLTHTEIRDAYKGTGAGSFLVRRTLDELRERGVLIVPTCPFVGAWIRRHEDYRDLVDHETLRTYKRSRSAGRRRLVNPPLFDPTGSVAGRPCAHVPENRSLLPRPWPENGCAECIAAGRRDWVHLRWCAGCGHIGCCDDSPGRHATAHAEQADHPLVRSHEAGETWWYCYVDRVTFEYSPSTTATA